MITKNHAIIIIIINDLLFLIFYYILTIIIIGEREKIITDKKIMIKLFDNPLKDWKEHESNPRFTKQTFFQDLVNPFLSLIFIIIWVTEIVQGLTILPISFSWSSLPIQRKRWKHGWKYVNMNGIRFTLIAGLSKWASSWHISPYTQINALDSLNVHS